MKRMDAIKKVMEGVTDELVIATTGEIGRELFYVKDRPENFYMCGSMGNALPIAIGLALHTDKKVVVLNGDGAALMSLGSMVVANHLKLKNLKHYILDNNAHDSAGGQPTCSRDIDFTALGDVEVIEVEKGSAEDLPKINIPFKELKERFVKALRK